MGVSSIFYEFMIVQRLRLRKQTAILLRIGACRSGGFVNAASISAQICVQRSSVLLANRNPQLPASSAFALDELNKYHALLTNTQLL
jgi:hypothetical protein